MNQIKQALDALGKATPGPWKGTECLPYQCVINGLYPVAETTGPDDYVVANLALIAAAPDMAAWIKKALPYIMREGKETAQIVAMEMHDKRFDEQLAELTDLVKQAKE